MPRALTDPATQISRTILLLPTIFFREVGGACAGPDGNGMAGQWGLMGVGYRAWLGLLGVG